MLYTEGLRTKKQVMQPYKMMNTELAEVKCHLYLGLELSNDLSLGIHINNTVGKAIRVLNFLRRNLHDSPRSIKKRTMLTSDQLLSTSVLCGIHISYVISITSNRYKDEVADLSQVDIKEMRVWHRWSRTECTLTTSFHSKANHDVESSK